MDIDTANKFFVGGQGDAIVITGGASLGTRRLTKAEALNLAAWLVALADEKNEFPALLEAVKNT